MNQRASGILLHPSSLSNAHSIGDLGPAANAFVDFLSASGQRRWQMLPIGPIGGDNSPYQSPSAFAGNPLLLNPDRLVEQGLVSREEISRSNSSTAGGVNFPGAARWKTALLKKAYEHFGGQEQVGRPAGFDAFSRAESYWLDDFSIFSAWQGAEGTADWTRWEPGMRTRQPAAMRRAEKRFANDIRYHKFVQWQFSMQWKELKDYSNAKGIRLIGDIPLFVAQQSADVWAHPELFKLNAEGAPTVVAGVPPDYFSKTGQRWGLPVYRWEALQAENYRWWIERLRTAFGRFDINRLDHFIGFVRTYEISAQASTALKGTYLPGGGAAFFKVVHEALGWLPFIADDLGDTTPEVVALLDQLQIPGTSVLQFELGSDLRNNSNPPAPHPAKVVVYTGTHDNDTTAGWYEKLPDLQREALRKKLAAGDREMIWAIIGVALASPADTAIVPVQDLLELGSEARMNFPGIVKGNWGWRLNAGALTQELAQRLRSLTMASGRLLPENPMASLPIQHPGHVAQIATRAYELYEQRGHQSRRPDEDWLQAEREINLAAIQ